MLPLWMHLNVASPGHRRVRLWLPLFLLWPLVLLLLLPLLAITALVDVALLAAGQTYHHYTVLLVRALGLVGELRGLVVRVRGDRSTVDVTVV